MKLLVAEGKNNFIVEWNDKREEELKEEGLTDEDFTNTFTDDPAPVSE